MSCRFQDLRHTSVALAISTRAHPKAIQSQMGHSSIKVTLERYAHLFPELDEAIAASFGERFAEARLRQSLNVIHTAFKPLVHDTTRDVILICAPSSRCVR